jgi:hypothetical protein
MSPQVLQFPVPNATHSPLQTLLCCTHTAWIPLSQLSSLAQYDDVLV